MLTCPICGKKFNPVEDLGDPITVRIALYRGQAAELKIVPCAECYAKADELISKYAKALVAQLAEALV